MSSRDSACSKVGRLRQGSLTSHHMRIHKEGHPRPELPPCTPAWNRDRPVALAWDATFLRTFRLIAEVGGHYLRSRPAILNRAAILPLGLCGPRQKQRWAAISEVQKQRQLFDLWIIQIPTSSERVLGLGDVRKTRLETQDLRDESSSSLGFSP